MNPKSSEPMTSDMATVFAALGNPTRMRILEILAENPDSIVASIVAQLPLAQATVSQHLKVLREAGLIQGERREAGRCSCCQIDHDMLSQFAQDVVGWLFKLSSRTRRAEPAKPCGCGC